MSQINTFIEILEKAGIKYDVDQTTDEDSRHLEVYVYDINDSAAIFTFEACGEPDLKDFSVIK